MHLKKITIDAQKFPTREQYPSNLDIISHTQTISLDLPVSFFVGENGSGKSTLLKAIARKCGIHIWSGMQTPRFQKSQYEDQLHHAVSVEWETEHYRIYKNLMRDRNRYINAVVAGATD